MRARSPRVVVAALVLSAVWATGCEKIFGIGQLPYPPEAGIPDSAGHVESGPPPRDGGMEADTRAPTDSGTAEASETGPVCSPVLPYTPVPWKPPTAFMQPACAMSQLTAYETCFPNCENFRTDPANAACVSCIETDQNAPAHGPVITALMGGVTVPVLVNIGGCQAQEDGVSTPNCCGQQEDDSLGCLSTECGTCSDFKDPGAGGPASTCEAAATTSTTGVCASYVPMPACDAELDGGVASMCTSLAAFLPTWCAPPGPPPSCYVNEPFTAPLWEPPTAFGQAACSASQVSDYVACFPNCATFASDPDNTPCLDCIQTDMSNTQYGPVVTSGGTPVQVNFGGCVANLDGNPDPGSCGNLFNSFDSCLSLECATCSDFDDPTPGGPTQECTENAFNGGACTPYNAMMCDSEISDGGVAAPCSNLADFLPLWCEGIAVDAGDGGGGD